MRAGVPLGSSRALSRASWRIGHLTKAYAQVGGGVKMPPEVALRPPPRRGAAPQPGPSPTRQDRSPRDREPSPAEGHERESEAFRRTTWPRARGAEADELTGVVRNALPSRQDRHDRSALFSTPSRPASTDFQVHPP